MRPFFKISNGAARFLPRAAVDLYYSYHRGLRATESAKPPLKCAADVLVFVLEVPRGSGQHFRLAKPGYLFRVARLLLFSSANSNAVRHLLLSSAMPTIPMTTNNISHTAITVCGSI